MVKIYHQPFLAESRAAAKFLGGARVPPDYIVCYVACSLVVAWGAQVAPGVEKGAESAPTVGPASPTTFARATQGIRRQNPKRIHHKHLLGRGNLDSCLENVYMKRFSNVKFHVTKLWAGHS